MTYIDRAMAKNALQKMRGFHEGIVNIYKVYDMNLLDNLGRRNIVMSQTQEKFFAQELAKKYTGVSEDGRTGQPDIVIGELDKELECKLTSRHKTGPISYHSDYETIMKKGSLEYLYDVADHDFKEFAVFLFEGLTVDDFRPLSNGARGKVAMYKHKAMKKCKPLLGSFEDINKKNLEKLQKRLATEDLPPYMRKKLQKSYKYWNDTPSKFSVHLEKVN